jgi:hypothetical protein
MEITIFKEITTEGVITSIEENSKKYYDGLYADMDNLPERTMVKKGAAEIGDIIKLLKTASIAITKANKAAVNKEHDAIVARLELANKPFTDLLDAYNVKRKVILDAENARKQAIIDLDLFNRDHEMALLIDKTYFYDNAEVIRVEGEREAKLIAQAIEDEREQQAWNKEHQEQQAINEENARLASKSHVGNVNRGALRDLMYLGLSENNGKAVIAAISKNEISNVKINY